jgi:NDP-sugar pyrophosphorylase family protein
MSNPPQSDLLRQFESQILKNKKEKVPYHENLPPIVKQISLDSSVLKDLEIGEKSSISKSNIGYGVKIGARSKIVNSVILSDVVIGNE